MRDAERAVERELEVQRAVEKAADAARESYAKAEENLEAALMHYEEAERTLEVERALEEEGGGIAGDEQVAQGALANEVQGGRAGDGAQTMESREYGRDAQEGGTPKGKGAGQPSAGAEVDFSSLSEEGRRLFAEATARCDLATAEGQKRAWAAVRRLQGGDPKPARQVACPPARSQPR